MYGKLNKTHLFCCLIQKIISYGPHFLWQIYKKNYLFWFKVFWIHRVCCESVTYRYCIRSESAVTIRSGRHAIYKYRHCILCTGHSQITRTMIIIWIAIRLFHTLMLAGHNTVYGIFKNILLYYSSSIRNLGNKICWVQGI